MKLNFKPMYDFKKEEEILKKVEKDLNVENWVKYSFYIDNPDHTRRILYFYDIPVPMFERWLWVIRWRRSKLICQYPRKTIKTDYHRYDKNTGLETGYKSQLGELVSIKCRIIKIENAMKEYISYWLVNNLFFDEETDELLVKARNMLKGLNLKTEMLRQEIMQETEKLKNN
ncbi:MAG: hypothetical protein LUH04_12515 [Clostridium sp.]|nr:hypothetical protein [Clostridium sp.]